MEDKNITGIIEEDVLVNNGVKTDGTPWKKIGIKVGEKMFGTFDDQYESLKKGDTVEIDYFIKEVNGKFYNNIKSIKKIEGQSALPSTPKVEVPVVKVPVVTEAEELKQAAPVKIVKPNYYDTEKEKNASIVGQVILKAVAEMVCSGNIKPGEYNSHANVLVDVYKTVKAKLLRN